MKHPYLINLNDPEDVAEHHVDQDRNAGFIKERIDLLVENIDYNDTHELTRSVFYAGDVMDNHVAKRGCETMIVLDGEIELTHRGKRCKVTPGDIMHLGPFESHRMHFLTDITWVGYFNTMNIIQPCADKELLSANCPEMTDEELADVFGVSYDLWYLKEAVAEDSPKAEVSAVREPGFAHAEFDVDGAKLRLKVGRWETAGEFELWQIVGEKGFYAVCPKPCLKPNIFFVTEGKVRFKVFNEEFVASEKNVVHLPPYAIFSYEVEENAKMYDYSIGCMRYDLLSELKSYSTYEPEKLNDPDFVAALRKKWGGYITEYGKR